MTTWNTGRTNVLCHSSFCKGSGQPYYISTQRIAPTANHKTTSLEEEKQSSNMSIVCDISQLPEEMKSGTGRHFTGLRFSNISEALHKPQRLTTSAGCVSLIGLFDLHKIVKVKLQTHRTVEGRKSKVSTKPSKECPHCIKKLYFVFPCLHCTNDQSK
jgi:hypothetical protein